MKTLDEIVKRSDYVHVTRALKNRAMELAEVLLDKLVELDLFDFDGLVVVKTRETNSYHGFLLCIYVKDESRRGCLRILNTTKATEFTTDDGLFVCDAQPEDFLFFVNKANQIVQDLDEFETEKTKAIEMALSNLQV